MQTIVYKLYRTGKSFTVTDVNMKNFNFQTQHAFEFDAFFDHNNCFIK